MTTYDAVIGIDASEAHVLMFDREHVESRRIMCRTHHKPSDGRAESSHDYFAVRAKVLAGVHEILLTGPAQTKEEFGGYCKSKARSVEKAIVGVVTTDHPADPLIVALARQYCVKFDRMPADPSLR